MTERQEKGSSTLENVFFGAAFLLFLVVGYFAAKRFGLFPARASETAPVAAVPPDPEGRFRVGIDGHLTGHEIVGRESGPVATGAPALKGARSHRRRTAAVPSPK